MASATYSSPFPIVFICDFANRDQDIPEYVPSSVATATDSCISVRTISEVDGDVTVSLEENLDADIERRGIEVFAGQIVAPGRRVAVVDSENNKLLESNDIGPHPFIRVMVDDEAHPATIWIEARAPSPR